MGVTISVVGRAYMAAGGRAAALAVGPAPPKTLLRLGRSSRPIGGHGLHARLLTWLLVGHNTAIMRQFYWGTVV